MFWSEPLSKSEKGESNATAKKKSKSKTSHPGKQVSFSHLALLQSHQQYRYIKWPSSVQSQVVVDGKADRLKEFRSLVEDAHTAMADLRTRNAEQAFSRALTLLETVTTKVILVLTVAKLKYAKG